MNSSNWKEIFKAIPLPSLILKPLESGFFLVEDVNEAYLQLFNRSSQDLLKKHSCDIFPKILGSDNNGHQVLKKSLKKVLLNGSTETLNSIRFDRIIEDTLEFEERYYTCTNIPIKNEKGEVELILHTTQDITQEMARKEREKLLQAEIDINRQQYRNFIRKNPDGLYRMDLEGNFLSVNEGLAKLAALPVEEIQKMNFLPFCAPHHKEYILEQFQKAVVGKTITFEGDFINAKGDSVILQILLMPMVINGKVAEVHGIAKDISGVKESEKVIIEKSRFLEVNAAFVSSLLENELEDESLYSTFEVIAETVEADRMYYFGADKDQKTGDILISQKVEWCSDKASVQLNNPNMQNLPLKDIEEITASFSENLPFSATRRELSPGALLNIFLDQEIQSMLLLPIYVEDQLFGFVGFDDCTTERTWKKEEISFLQSLTHNLTNAFEKDIALKKVKRREEEMVRSERKFKALVQEGSDMIAIVDLQGNAQFISETSTSILGLAPEKVLGQNMFDLVHPDDLQRLHAEFAELKSKKQKKSTPYRIWNNDGEWRWVQSVGTNLIDDPAVNGIVLNSRDITTVIQQARQIEQINERYRLAATATQDLIYDWDLKKDEVIRFHQSVQELFGYSSSEVNDKDFWQNQIHPDDFVKEKNKLQKVLEDATQNHIKTEYRFRRADGTYAKVVDKGYIIRDHQGKALRLIGATSDISDITEKKEALKIANKRFEMAMKATNEMIWDWDIATDSVTRSKGYKNIFGYDTNEATSVHSFWLNKVAPKDQIKVRTSLNRALADPKREKWKLEYRLTKANGKTAYVTDRGYILRDKEGNATRVIGAVLDVTYSRKLIKRIKRQNAVLKEIAWEQSHVVRAPLARIKGLLHLLEQETFEEMSREQVLCHIRNSTDELDGIIRNIVGKTEKMEVQSVKSS